MPSNCDSEGELTVENSIAVPGQKRRVRVVEIPVDETATIPEMAKQFMDGIEAHHLEAVKEAPVKVVESTTVQAAPDASSSSSGDTPKTAQVCKMKRKKRVAPTRLTPWEDLHNKARLEQYKRFHDLETENIALQVRCNELSQQIKEIKQKLRDK
jgi:hypothetical protein